MSMSDRAFRERDKMLLRGDDPPEHERSSAPRCENRCTIWTYSGPHEGLYYSIRSSGGIVLNAATRPAAEAVVSILNHLEERAAFAEQINQDHCENAFIEATIHKQVVRAASAAVIAFGSETEADAIYHLGQVLAGNVYSLIKEPVKS